MFLSLFNSSAQELPPVINYTPKDYGAENQNWGISQSENKHIYVANNSGLLEFNGARWKLYNAPNNTVIRSVKVIGDKIYTGCHMEFGYWEKNKYGNLTYNSLIDKLNTPMNEDEEFWNIVEFDSWILFQSLNRIYIYDTVNQLFDVISSETQLPKVFKVNNSIYFQKINNGVFKIENGEPVLISDHAVLKNNILVNIFSFDNKILLLSQENGFYIFENEKLKKWNIQANEVLSFVSVYSSTRLHDGSYILGTISKGVFHLDSNGNIIEKIHQENGLNDNTILSVFEDQDHNLWLGLDNGISIIDLESPLKVYTDINGYLGSVYASITYDDYIYIGTNQGLFYKRNNTNSPFSFIEGTKGQVWCLKIYDDTLFCGHNSGTFVIDGTSANLIVDAMGTWNIQSVENTDNLLIQGHYNGLNVIEKINDQWQFRNEIDGFNNSSRYFELIADNQVFISHEYKGIFRLKLNKDYTKVLEYAIEKNVDKGLRSSLVAYNKDLLYTTESGVFKFDKTLNKFVRDPLLSINLFAHDEYISGKLIVDNLDNALWGFTDKNIVYFTPGKLNNVLKAGKIPLPASTRRFVTGYENLSHLNNNSYLFGTSRGYFVLDLTKIDEKEFEISINSIEKSILNASKNPVSFVDDKLKYKENNVYFSYSVAQFNKYTEVNYQYKLEGIYDSWSHWDTESEIAFKNLPFGNYSFKVRAQIGNKLSKNVASYSFKIQRPFIISNLMLSIYAVLLIALFLLIHNLYKQYYTRQKHKLVEKKQREFVMAQLENEQEIMALRNDKLQQDIESKSRELAVSTMSIIKKNELLSTIKNELAVIKNEKHVKPVIRIINRNLSNTSDWELFKEAFNNADSDFLKKVKTIHLSLTPNDLRLCAYLRLNLSSKEIAPLLNISVRSVEIKRYRLRKKMGLEHEKGLVEYILSI